MRPSKRRKSELQKTKQLTDAERRKIAVERRIHKRLVKLFEEFPLPGYDLKKEQRHD